MRSVHLFVLTLTFSVAASAQQARMALADVVSEALAKNPEIAAAQKRYEAARQRPVQERSLPDPMVSAGYNSSGNPLPGAGLGTEPTANIGFMVSQELPYPGKLALRGSIAAREADAELQQIEAARLNVVARVKQAYYRLSYTHAVTEVLTRNRELLDTLLKVSENRYTVGEAAQQDVIKAQTQISILDLQLERVRQERATREGELNALLARPANSSLGEPDAMQLTPFELSLDSLVVAAQMNAPMLKRDQIMIDRSQLAVHAARKEYKPDVDDPFSAILDHVDRSHTRVEQVYELDKAGAFQEKDNAAARHLVYTCTLEAATLLRDLVYTAWLESGETPPSQTMQPMNPKHPQYNPATGSAPAAPRRER